MPIPILYDIHHTPLLVSTTSPLFSPSRYNETKEGKKEKEKEKEIENKNKNKNKRKKRKRKRKKQVGPDLDDLRSEVHTMHVRERFYPYTMPSPPTPSLYSYV